MDDKLFTERDKHFIKNEWSNSIEEIERMKIVVELKKVKIMQRQLELQENFSELRASAWIDEGYRAAMDDICEEFSIGNSIDFTESNEALFAKVSEDLYLLIDNEEN
jgi:hypothetical protein